jgi:hypothetical protein
MTLARGVSRRDFLRLRPTARGRLLEISCRTLFMRCSDAGLEPATSSDYEPWMGEPSAVIRREPAEAILGRVEHELNDAQIVRLLEPEWLSSMAGGARLQSALARFRERGGVLENGPHE